MGSFFFALFGIVWLTILFTKDAKSNSAYQAKIDTQKSRSDKWYARVNNGPLNNAQFEEKLRTDRGFREKLLADCNAVFDSLPAMGGAHITDAYNTDSRRILEMMYNARTGDISFMWFSGWIYISDITKGFSQKISVNGCNSFMSWYQCELRRNGYPGATILPINNRGNVLGYYFTDGATSYELIKHRFYLD